MNTEKPKKVSFTIKQIIEKPIQLIFFILVIILALVLIPFTTIGYTYIRKLMSEVPVGYDYPKVSDFRLSIFAACVLASLQHLSSLYVGPLWKSLCKDQDDEQKLQLKMEKAGKYTFGFCYMLCITCFAYSILKD